MKDKKKPQDRATLDTKFLSAVIELAEDNEKRERKGKKPRAVSPGHVAKSIEIHHDSVIDRVNTFTILQNLDVRIETIETTQGNTMLICKKDKRNSIVELNERINRIEGKIDKILEKE